MRIVLFVVVCIFCVTQWYQVFILSQDYTNYSKQSIIKNCPFEGKECPNADYYSRDYQLELYMDTVWVYDGDKLVDKYTSNWNTHLDSVLLRDNE